MSVFFVALKVITLQADLCDHYDQTFYLISLTFCLLYRGSNFDHKDDLTLGKCHLCLVRRQMTDLS